MGQLRVVSSAAVDLFSGLVFAKIKHRPGAKGGGNNVGIRAGVRTGRKISSSVEFASTTAGSDFVLGPSGCADKSVITLSETCVSCTGFRRLDQTNIVCIAGVGGGLICRISTSAVCVARDKLVTLQRHRIAFAGGIGSNSSVGRRTHVIACISRGGEKTGLVSLLAGSVRVDTRSVITVCQGH